MREILAGFRKESEVPAWEIGGGLVGAGIAAALTRKSNPIQSTITTAIASNTGWQLGAGIRAVRERADLSDLTEAERAVIDDEIETLSDQRNVARAKALGTGALFGLLGGPQDAIAYLPRVTVAPYIEETDRINDLASNFRRARRKHNAKRTGE